MKRNQPASPNYQIKISVFAALLDLQPPVEANPRLGSILAHHVSQPERNLAQIVSAHQLLLTYEWLSVLLKRPRGHSGFPRFTPPRIPSELLVEVSNALRSLRIDLLGECEIDDYIKLYKSELRANSKPQAKLFHSPFDGKKPHTSVLTHKGPLTEEDLRIIQEGWLVPPSQKQTTCSNSGIPNHEAFRRITLFDYVGHERGNCTPITGHREILFSKRTAQWLSLMESINRRLSIRRYDRSIPEVVQQEKTPHWISFSAESIFGADGAAMFRLQRTGMSAKDIATKLGLKLDTVSRRLRRGFTPKVHRRVIIAWLHYHERYTSLEIAEALGIMQKSVQQVISRLQAEGE